MKIIDVVTTVRKVTRPRTAAHARRAHPSRSSQHSEPLPESIARPASTRLRERVAYILFGLAVAKQPRGGRGLTAKGSGLKEWLSQHYRGVTVPSAFRAMHVAAAVARTYTDNHPAAFIERWPLARLLSAPETEFTPEELSVRDTFLAKIAATSQREWLNSGAVQAKGNAPHRDPIHGQPSPLHNPRFTARLGALVLAFRKSKQLTQAQLAAQAKCCTRTVQLVEQGTHDCGVSTIRAIERGLGIHPGLLMKLAK